MIRPECLDPKEVLTHLQSLGYNDISPQQLKEFIHDLKKLIKYEQKHLNCTKTKSLSLQASGSECSCVEYENNSEKSSSSENYNSSVSSCSISSECINVKSNKCDENTQQKTRRQLDYELSQKVQTSCKFSFQKSSTVIRPWNLHAGKEASNKCRKHFDPVSLYHQYRKIWSQQNIPGERKHAQLCWFIRSRMMGQEPSPRVCTGSNRGFTS